MTKNQRKAVYKLAVVKAPGLSGGISDMIDLLGHDIRYTKEDWKVVNIVSDALTTLGINNIVQDSHSINVQYKTIYIMTVNLALDDLED